ncbi:iron-siderophore ABC transporter substrate-binding protein [Romeria aff. gracilis LEGE 07310]|uniref:Iron-siderophore ABC transporter substrate-binding protein n=1 Tax=Vasconcelosia minhoensis LEGE 07310 TaxID=915328 RepID=A0A8J7DEK6_9CYAN|nr:iron-siderophore ABC transporter substrate-binding protein [Romeria gracilis]MBE9079853.1 iron-siderophore ABC transporter substrate-binding protein [Romeria aff. gracilis LEGE 07310]
MKVELRAKFWVLGALMLFFISACSSRSQKPSEIEAQPSVGDCQIIQHEAGETEICGNPQKAAVLGPHMLDILLSLGEQPAGYAEWYTEGVGNPVTEIPVLDSRVTTQPLNLGLRNTPSLEALVKLKPDIILGESLHEPYYSKFSDIAPTLLFSGQGNDWKHSIPKIAQVFGREEQAQKVIEAHRQKLAETRAELAPVTDRYPRVLIFATPQLPNSINVRTGESLSGTLFEQLGFELALPKNQQAEFGEIPVSLEVLPQLEADIVIVIVTDYLHDDAMEQVKQAWKQNPITQSMQASKEGRVYFVEYYTWGSNMRGPIAADIILDETRQLLLPLASKLNR